MSSEQFRQLIEALGDIRDALDQIAGRLHDVTSHRDDEPDFIRVNTR